METCGTNRCLTRSQRDRVLAAVYRELFLTCPLGEEEVRPADGAEAIERHIDALVDIVRRSTAETVEPYLAQIHKDVCSKRVHQTVSGFCPSARPGRAPSIGSLARSCEA